MNALTNSAYLWPSKVTVTRGTSFLVYIVVRVLSSTMSVANYTVVGHDTMQVNSTKPMYSNKIPIFLVYQCFM